MMCRARFGTVALIDAQASSCDVRRLTMSLRGVRFAREHNLEIAVKGGGHHAAGHASTDGGVLLDLGGLRAIEVDPEQRIAVGQAGLTWAHFDQVTQAFGLACTGPIVSMTGVAGFTLGGGFGWLHRKIGLGCDNLKSATVVTADGKLVKASEVDSRDLLWGLRGSGWNFGVITSMGFQLHPIGPSVTAGLLYFPLALFPELVDHHREWVSQFPDELTTWFSSDSRRLCPQYRRSGSGARS